MMRAFCILTAAFCTLNAAAIPVRHVVLYKHGVGYFERSGQLAAGESVRLDFDESAMNDVLKSFTITDAGGKVTGLRYDSSQPIEVRLAEFPFSLGENQPLSDLLDQLKGARIEMRAGAETVTGSIVSARALTIDEKRPKGVEQAVVMLDSGEFRTIDLASVSGLKLLDAKLQVQFKDYLAALSGARSKDKRSIYIDSTDQKARQIASSYVIPTPVWKSSYRLIFPAAGQPTLEGWAIVDNTTHEDWTNVRLSLVSGRPISFISKLYPARYVSRPEMELPEERAQRPVVHEGGVAGAAPEARKAAGPRIFAASPPPPRAMAETVTVQRADITSSIAETAATREAGELFEYSIATPVTVRKSESAMLPFIQQKIDARKLLIYSEPSSQHPTNAIEVTNITGKTLDGGPVTVFDGGTYGGEALMETLKAGDKRLVSYAVDLGTRITTAFDSRAAVTREVHFRRGVLTARNAMAETRTFTIRNVDAKPKTLIIEHRARPGFALTSGKPAERTANAYRFEVKLAPSSDQTFAISEENVFDTTYSSANLTPDLLFTFVQNKALTETARKQLEQILAIKRKIAATGADTRRGEAELAELIRDQERIRQNIASLNQVSGQQQQVQTYARQLVGQEAKLAALRDRIAELERQRAALDAELSKLLETMEF
ncbi:MAG: DUF4139 domain-containing protein [Bryobacteraceae bacterium]